MDANVVGEHSSAAARPSAVVGALLGWLKAHPRDLPWRRGVPPFEVLVAEILLRQTRAISVPHVLETLLSRWPGPEDLAAAGTDEIASVIGVLGFGRQRAAQLRAMALRLVELHSGNVPGTALELRELPGVGPYTAGLVAATCFEQPEPAVDTNVARVLCRLHGLAPSHAEPRKSTNVWEAAAELIAAEPAAAARVTWAIVDLAASVCKGREPLCAECPLRPFCVTAAAGTSPGDAALQAPALGEGGIQAKGGAPSSTPRHKRGP